MSAPPYPRHQHEGGPFDDCAGCAVMTSGQLAYEGYLACSGGVSLVSGARLPTWAEQAAEIRAAWDAAAGVVELRMAGVEALDAIATVRRRQ